MINYKFIYHILFAAQIQQVSLTQYKSSSDEIRTYTMIYNGREKSMEIN